MRPRYVFPRFTGAVELDFHLRNSKESNEGNIGDHCFSRMYREQGGKSVGVGGSLNPVFVLFIYLLFILFIYSLWTYDMALLSGESWN